MAADAFSRTLVTVRPTTVLISERLRPEIKVVFILVLLIYVDVCRCGRPPIGDSTATRALSDPVIKA